MNYWTSADCAKAWHCSLNAARRSMPNVPGAKQRPVEGHANIMEWVVPERSARPPLGKPGIKPGTKKKEPGK